MDAPLTPMGSDSAAESPEDHPKVEPGDRFAFEPLTEEGLRDFSAFSCGPDPWHIDLNEYLRDDALKHQAYEVSKTYLCYGASAQPVGFVSVSAAHLHRTNVTGRRIPYEIVPALLIGRLGVAEAEKDRGYGKKIIAVIRQMARILSIGCRMLALQVDVENIAAVGFYEHQGFMKAREKQDDGTYTDFVERSMYWMFYDLYGSI